MKTYTVIRDWRNDVDLSGVVAFVGQAESAEEATEKAIAAGEIRFADELAEDSDYEDLTFDDASHGVITFEADVSAYITDGNEVIYWDEVLKDE